MNLTEYKTMAFGEHGWAEFFKLSDNVVSYLWQCIQEAENDNVDVRGKLAGNISESLLLKDKSNVILSDVIPSINQSNIIKEISKNREGSFTPVLKDFWVNYQYKYEFNPLHWHSGDISFVIWMRIPYDWVYEKQQEHIKYSGSIDKVGNFCFVWAEDTKLESHVLYMNKEMEGYMAVFPSWLGHMVYPFYTTDDARISISGNVNFETTPNQ